ncbi:MAG TPA: CsbD family protein [Thermoanaerobaculia bacterium]|jgi:uncharacterized protein YjbJ (UPF0337 family)|nr:CsbD family protein [Thermoanaerobaculia bacterium]
MNNTRLPYNDDEVKGKIDQTVGKVKESIGRNAGDPVLEQEGADQRAAGDARHGIGKARRKVGEVISDVGKKLGR